MPSADDWNSCDNLMQSPLSIAYSLADQGFSRATSIGILNLSVQLVRHLDKRSDLTRLVVFDSGTNGLDFKTGGRTEVHRYDHVMRNRWARIMWDQFGVYAAARRTGNEWLFLPKGFASFVRRCPIRLATYVHDVIQEFYAVRYPGARSELERRYFRYGFRASLQDSQVVFVNTEFTRQEVLRYADRQGLCAPHVLVAGIGFEHFKCQAPREGNRRGVVVLASRYRHKRSDLAVRFMEQWQTETAYSEPVVWVGNLPEGLELPTFPNWRRSGRLEDSEFQNLVGTSRALVYFSEYEGFGMPPVEAVLTGACPVFSMLPATREVMRGCGKGFENDSYLSFTTAMREAMRMDAETLKGWQERLKVHSWSAVVSRVIDGLLQAQQRKLPVSA